MPVIMRLTWVRRSRSTLYGQVSVCCFAGLVEVVVDELDGEPARDLARRVTAHAVGHDHEALVSGSEIESSLWSRFRPMLVAPANRTRMPVERERSAHRWWSVA